MVGKRQLPGRDARPDVDEIQPGGEVVAVREEHAGPNRVVGFQQRIGTRQVGQHRSVERIAFVWPVEADQQDVTVPLQGDGVQGR